MRAVPWRSSSPGQRELREEIEIAVQTAGYE
jgi:hypothetical protein